MRTLAALSVLLCCAAAAEEAAPAWTPRECPDGTVLWTAVVKVNALATEVPRSVRTSERPLTAVISRSTRAIPGCPARNAFEISQERMSRWRELLTAAVVHNRNVAFTVMEFPSTRERSGECDVVHVQLLRPGVRKPPMQAPCDAGS